jgi:hypothetical protein
MADQCEIPARSFKKKRIETQIHRRRAAPASGSMESEWDASQEEPPNRLKMMPSPAQPRTEEHLSEHLE